MDNYVLFASRVGDGIMTALKYETGHSLLYCKALTDEHNSIGPYTMYMTAQRRAGHNLYHRVDPLYTQTTTTYHS